jgi:hypothetical protein
VLHALVALIVDAYGVAEESEWEPTLPPILYDDEVKVLSNRVCVLVGLI